MNTILEVLLEEIKSAVFSDAGKVEEPVTPYTVFKHYDDYFFAMRKGMLKNTELFEGRIYTVINDPTAIGKGEVRDLFDFAQALFQPTRHIDTDLARMLYASLIEYARINNNTDLLIKCLYWKGLSLMYIDQSMFYDEIHTAFTEAANFRFKYKEIANFETRKYINRSLGNIFVIRLQKRRIGEVQPFIDAVNAASEFWNDPDIRAFDPEMPFEQFIYSIHQNTCVYLDYLREKTDKQLAERVYESALIMAGGEKSYHMRSNASAYPSRIAYNIICAEYHSGRISAREAGNKLLSFSQTAVPNDYSLDNALKILHIAVAGVGYLKCDEQYPVLELGKVTDEVIKTALDYCSKLPSGITTFSLNSMLYQFIQGMSGLLNKDTFLELVLSMTVHRHMPTYVHSITVSQLSEAFCEHFLQTNPSYFVGVWGFSKEEILINRGKLLEFVRMAGLTHDVGKIKYINILANYGRNASEYERAVIHQHSEEGNNLLKSSENADLADVALLHHVWYDGKGGYPQNVDRKNHLNPFIDIIAVCDSISAATDRLGRPYKDCLSLEDIIKEINAYAGNRYSPAVVEILKDKTLLSKINTILTVKRREAYFTAYGKIIANN